MAEFSLPWGGIVTGDCGPYSDDQWTDVWRKRSAIYRTSRGVLKLYANELAVSGVASPLAVATGAALVDGKYYENTAALAVVVPAPAALTRIDRIVLQKDWAAQTVRVVRVPGIEGGAAPALTQVDGVTWEISLAQVSTTILGVITVTDERQFMLLGAAHELLTPDDGWIDLRDRETWTWVAATQFSVPTDRTAAYRKGAKLRWKEGGAFKYAYVVSSAFGAVTTVTLTGGSDYALAGGAITDNSISYIENPAAFPDWFNWAPTIVGYGVVPPNATYRFCIKGRTVWVHMEEGTDGTSNAVNLTYTLPVTALIGANDSRHVVSIKARDNGADVLMTARCSIITGAPTLLTCSKTIAGGAWTNVNAKVIAGYGLDISYEMA